MEFEGKMWKKWGFDTKNFFFPHEKLLMLIQGVGCNEETQHMFQNCQLTQHSVPLSENVHETVAEKVYSKYYTDSYRYCPIRTQRSR